MRVRVPLYIHQFGVRGLAVGRHCVHSFRVWRCTISQAKAIPYRVGVLSWHDAEGIVVI
mgnify:CR=1 FL=1